MYKEEKEAFVSNLHGSSIWELIASLLIGPVVSFLYASLRHVGIGPSVIVEWTFRFFIPSLLLTVWADFIVPFTLISISTSFLILNISSKPLPQGKLSKEEEERPPFITRYRTGMMIGTCIAILAVDFPAFPRRFAKTERYGYSAMDCGVGMFVFASGLISRAAKSGGSKKGSLPILRILRGATPIIILGVARFLFVRGVDYQTHVSEYGVHWNFYFTLGFLSVVVGIVLFLVPHSVITWFAGILISVYQIFLLYFGGTEYIMEAPRVSVFSANREGILGLSGFTCIYLFGVSYGTRMWKKGMSMMALFWSLVKDAVLLWTLSIILELFVQPPSRRMVNAGFVVYVLAANVTCLGGAYVEQMLLRSPRSSLAESVARNQLAVFLFANILTGIVNFGVKTLYCSNMCAVVLISAYCIVLCVFSLTFHRFNVTLKFW